MVQLVIPFTRGGVNCLTPQQVDNIICNASASAGNGTSSDGAVFSFSVFDAYAASKACAKLGVGYGAFCGYKNNFKTIMTIRQAWIGPHMSAPNTENAVVGECEAGRATIDMKALVKAVSDFKPTWCLPLYGGGCVEDVPTKKARTAAIRTSKWYDAATQQVSLKDIVAVPSSVVATATEDNMSQSPLVFLDAAGQGESLGARLAATSRMVDTSNGGSSSSDNASSIAKKATFVIAESIPSILLAALAGATLVECEYSFACARRGQGLDLTPIMAVLKGSDATISDAFVYDLNDQKYQLNTVPFAPTCGCYSCKRHTKAYIYHLLSVQEMNTDTLLTIHNLSQILELCEVLKRVAADNSEAIFKQRVHAALALLNPSA